MCKFHSRVRGTSPRILETRPKPSLYESNDTNITKKRAVEGNKLRKKFLIFYSNMVLIDVDAEVDAFTEESYNEIVASPPVSFPDIFVGARDQKQVSDEEDEMLDELLADDGDGTEKDYQREEEEVSVESTVYGPVKSYTQLAKENWNHIPLEQSEVLDHMEEESFNSRETNKGVLDRGQQEILLQEMDRLQKELVKKNLDIEVLSGQLRQAVSTKCDLVLLHRDMESQLESLAKSHERQLQKIQRERLVEQESRAESEKAFMNEIYVLTNMVKKMEIAHRQALGDWERLHSSEILEKDYKIAQLMEKLRWASSS